MKKLTSKKLWLLLESRKSRVLSFLALLVLIAASSSDSHERHGKGMGEHYLLLVNTAYAPQLSAGKIAQFNQSPYDGIAVAFLHTYETSPIPDPAKMDAQIAEWKKVTNKDVWPWVFINRLLGIDPASKHPYTTDPYFKQIPGMDLDGKTGAQKDFLQNWQNALRTAKDTGAPGIVFDPEFYNYQNEYDVGELAGAIGKKPPEAVAMLRTLGAQMADTAASAYPGAILWFLFTGLTHPDYKVVGGVQYYPSPAYVTMGLLDEIQSKKLPLHLLSGGEGSLGYCHASLDEFQSSIRKRAGDFAPHLEKYKGILGLAGTLTLWSDPAAKKGWVKEGACETATAATVEDLEPYVELLLRSYGYNWIYGSVDGGYFAFEPSASRFDAVLSKAKSRTSELKAH